MSRGARTRRRGASCRAWRDGRRARQTSLVRMLFDVAARALGLVRFGNWWTHKIPPLLLVVYIELIRRHASLGASAAAICVLVFCVSCVAAYGHVVNDWCDIADDQRAGKPNAMRDVRVWQRAALCVGLVVAGFVVLAPFRTRGPRASCSH